MTASIPFRESYGSSIAIELAEQSSIDLTRYLETLSTPIIGVEGESFAYAVGINERISFHCTRPSRRHIPSCRAAILNRFESYNYLEPGYPDAIELPSDGRILFGAITLGRPTSSVAQAFQALLPLLPAEDGDSPGRLVHELLLEGDENGSSIWCNQYLARPENHELRSCLVTIERAATPVGPISIPLDVVVALDERASATLSNRLGGAAVEGFLTEVDASNDLAAYIGPIRPWMSLSCENESACLMHLTHHHRAR